MVNCCGDKACNNYGGFREFGLFVFAVVDTQKNRLVACVCTIRRASTKQENALFSCREKDATHRSGEG